MHKAILRPILTVNMGRDGRSLVVSDPAWSFLLSPLADLNRIVLDQISVITNLIMLTTLVNFEATVYYNYSSSRDMNYIIP